MRIRREVFTAMLALDDERGKVPWFRELEKDGEGMPIRGCSARASDPTASGGARTIISA